LAIGSRAGLLARAGQAARGMARGVVSVDGAPAMESAAALDRFDRLAVWSRGEQRAPHKPLLVLYALGRWARGDQGGIPFGERDRDRTELLQAFGPPRRSYHPEYPFWRLQ